MKKVFTTMIIDKGLTSLISSCVGSSTLQRRDENIDQVALCYHSDLLDLGKQLYLELDLPTSALPMYQYKYLLKSVNLQLWCLVTGPIIPHRTILT